MDASSPRSTRFRKLLLDVATGVPNAADTIVSQYGVYILRAVRRRMNRGIREQYDSEDFVQAVWASFFGRLSIVCRFVTEDELAGFLCRIASNKVIDAGRRRQTRPDQQAARVDNVLPVVHDERVRNSQPSPSQFAVANEQWENLNNAAAKSRQKRMLELLRAGVDRREIADKLGVSERHVRRILARIYENSQATER